MQITLNVIHVWSALGQLEQNGSIAKHDVNSMKIQDNCFLVWDIWSKVLDCPARC